MAKRPKKVKPIVTLDELKARIHHHTNCIQTVLGYMELEQYERAYKQIRTCIQEMRELAKLVAKLHAVVVVVPTNLIPPTP